MRGSRGGFTFIEALVTIGVLVLLTSVLVLYTRTGEQRVVILREKAQVISALVRAKSASINTLVGPEPVCGYGVYFEETAYTLYRDRGTDCRAGADHRFTANDELEVVETYTLPRGYRLSLLGVRDILFLPPAPTLFFDGAGAAAGQRAEITLTNDDATVSTVVRINHAGHISEQ